MDFDVGEKTRIAGGGRCNFTSLHGRPEAFLSRNPRKTWFDAGYPEFDPVLSVPGIDPVHLQYEARAAAGGGFGDELAA